MAEEKKVKGSFISQHPVLFSLLIIIVGILLYVLLLMPVCSKDQTDAGKKLCADQTGKITNFRIWLANNALYMAAFGVIVLITGYAFKRSKLFKEQVPEYDIKERFKDKCMKESGGQFIPPMWEIQVKEKVANSGVFNVSWPRININCVFDTAYKGYWKGTIFDHPDMVNKQDLEDEFERAIIERESKIPREY